MKKLLDAVTELLKAIGEPPLQNEDDFQFSYEAQQAQKTIERVKADVLGEGFIFNTLNIELQPDLEGFISIPPNALDLQFDDENLTVNDGMVFDRDSLTFKFENPIKVTVVYDEDFDYIPLALQKFIVAQSAVNFQNDMINDPATDASLQRKLFEATKNKNIWIIRQAKANGKDSTFSRNTNPTRT